MHFTLRLDALSHVHRNLLCSTSAPQLFSTSLLRSSVNSLFSVATGFKRKAAASGFERRGGMCGGGWWGEREGGGVGGEREERGKAVTRSNLPAPAPAPRPRRQPGGAAAGPVCAERAPSRGPDAAAFLLRILRAPPARRQPRAPADHTASGENIHTPSCLRGKKNKEKTKPKGKKIIIKKNPTPTHGRAAESEEGSRKRNKK